jgi:hypothetical protein
VVNRVVTSIGSEEHKVQVAACRRHGAERPLPIPGHDHYCQHIVLDSLSKGQS